MYIPQQFETVNPLDGLTEARLGMLLTSGQQGDYPELQWLYHFVEKRNATVRAVKRKLSNALLKLDWDIRIREDLTKEQEALAKQQQTELRTAYDRIGNLRHALEFLAMADLRGFAHCNKVYAGALPATDRRYKANSWDVVELRCVEPWLWSYDPRQMQWRYNPKGLSGLRQGTALENPDRDWVIREVTDPANEIFARAHLDMLLALDDWAQHNDTLAVPPMFVVMPPNVPPDKVKEYEAMADAVVSDGRGVLPNGASVELLTNDGAHAAFLARLEFWKKEIVLTGTNGLLTMLAESGSGTLAGGAHSDTWQEVASGLAAMVSATLQKQFDEPLLAERFPGQPVLAYFEFAAVEEEDSKAHLENAKIAKDAGYTIGADELSEKTGYKLEGANLAAGAAESTTKPKETPAGQQPAAPGVTPEPAQVQPTPGAATAGERNPNQNQPGNGAAAPTVTPETGKANVTAGAAPSEEPPIARPSRAGEASPGIVQAAVATFSGLEERWLAPVATILREVEAALADPAVTADELETILQKAHDSLPGLVPQMGIADLAQALAEAGAPAAIQGTVDALNGTAK